MKLFDILLGRTRPAKSRLDRLFAMSTASVTLQVNLQLDSSGRAGLCFRPLTSSHFNAAEKEMRQLVERAAGTSGTKVGFTQDSYGFRWVVLEDPQIEDLVAVMHMVSLTLQEHRFGEQLLAAVFKFLAKGRVVYWIYNYKRGAFYPLVPAPGERQRDHAMEMRLRALLEKELPMEKDTSRWYPLWEIPV